jgi:hypothetical protein
MYIPPIIKIGSGIQIYGGIHTDTPSNFKVLFQKVDQLEYRYY